MTTAIRTIPITQITLDETIYPRARLDRKRIAMFAENIRDEFETDPIEVQIHPDDENMFRILDGGHRFSGYKEVGASEVVVRIIDLNGDIKACFCFKIKSGAGLEAQLATYDLKACCISPCQCEVVGPHSVIADVDVSDLDGGGGIGIFRQGRGQIA